MQKNRTPKSRTSGSFLFAAIAGKGTPLCDALP